MDQPAALERRPRLPDSAPHRFYVRLNTVKLWTRVLHGEILVGLRGLWKRRKIAAGDIRSLKVVDYDPKTDFGGYGIRSGRGGTAYIASGNRAVELILRNGEKLLIGSQHPNQLAQAIQRCNDSVTFRSDNR